MKLRFRTNHSYLERPFKKPVCVAATALAEWKARCYFTTPWCQASWFPHKSCHSEAPITVFSCFVVVLERPPYMTAKKAKVLKYTMRAGRIIFAALCHQTLCYVSSPCSILLVMRQIHVYPYLSYLHLECIGTPVCQTPFGPC